MITIFTVKEHAQIELIEKKSKFIANVYHVSSKKEIDEILSKIKKEYWDAKHNVYAYTLEGNVSKYSDDGEPQGTSGLPVFNVISKNKLENVLVVVTRYFGGILLGKGGLVRAYTNSAKLGIEKAEIVEIIETTRIELKCEYQKKDKLLFYLDKSKYKKDVIYGESIKIFIDVPNTELDNFTQNVIKITEGKVSLNFMSE